MTVEELEKYGMEQMKDKQVEAFLSSQSLGILGLPTNDAPYLVPMSYAYDGGTRLYFFFIVGERSRKVELAEKAENASFLVFSAETLFNWRSAHLTGTIERLPDEKRTELPDGQQPAWRPSVLETASEMEATKLYGFEMESWTGIEHSGLPPGFSQ